LLAVTTTVRVNTTTSVRLVETTGTGLTAAIWLKSAAQVGVLMAAAIGIEDAARFKVVGGAAGCRAASKWFENAASVAPGAREKIQELSPEPAQPGCSRLCGRRNRGEGAQQEEGYESESWKLHAHEDSRESAPAWSP